MNRVKFTFDTEFSGGRDLASNEALARKPHKLTQSELDGLRAQALQEGRHSGEVRALEAIAAGAEDAAIAVREAIVRASEQIQGVRAAAADLALAAARVLAGAALSQFAADTVEEALVVAMHQAIGEPRLTLRASPAVADAIRPRIEEIAHHEGFEGRVIVASDCALANADCRIEWRGGGVERVQAVIEAALAGRIAQRFAQAPSVTLSKE